MCMPGPCPSRVNMCCYLMPLANPHTPFCSCYMPGELFKSPWWGVICIMSCDVSPAPPITT